mgnify:CR=1 FL=1
MIAVAFHTVGALGKLFSEVNENIDMGPLEGVKAAGGTWFDQIRYGAVPQGLPNIVSSSKLLTSSPFSVRSSCFSTYR